MDFNAAWDAYAAAVAGKGAMKSTEVPCAGGGQLTPPPALGYTARPMTLAESQHSIASDCDTVKELLLAKNRAYGNAALVPLRIFSKSAATEQIAVRIDDKLSRIAHTGFATADEDTVLDLIGYLHLLRIARVVDLRTEG